MKAAADVGGFGSGRRGGGGRIEAESCLRLDVRALHRTGYLAKYPRPGSWRWSNGSGEVSAVAFEGSAEAVLLTYTSHDTPRRYSIAVEWTPKPLGGRVPWFRCPGGGCGQRRAILFCAGGIFACRHCHRLAYASQNETALDRMQRRARKAWKRLGCDFPGELGADKPRGMHWRTYFARRNRAVELANAWTGGMDDRISRFVGGSRARLAKLARQAKMPLR